MVIIKWFQHISDSLDDPFIDDLMHEFGSKGYLVFFGTLEMLCREDAFDVPMTFKWRYLCTKVHLKRNSYETILNYIASKGRFVINSEKDTVSIFCPKLIELRDYKHRTKPKKRGTKCPAITQKLPKGYPLEKEKDTYIDKDILNTIVEKWNKNDYGSKITLTDKRKSKLKTRLKEKEFDIDKIITKVNVVKNTDFIKQNSWFTFDWIIKDDTNYIKLLEGNFDPKGKQKSDTEFIDI